MKYPTQVRIAAISSKSENDFERVHGQCFIGSSKPPDSIPITIGQAPEAIATDYDSLADVQTVWMILVGVRLTFAIDARAFHRELV
jgi:hypothetical protein